MKTFTAGNETKQPRQYLTIVCFLATFVNFSVFCWSPALIKRTPPYPASSVIGEVIWDEESLVRAAPGSDLWPLTWADDGHLYTAWGDGGGFEGTDQAGRVKLGIARVTGSGDQWQGDNIFGGKTPGTPATFDGKVHGIVAIDSVLYIIVTEEDRWMRGKIGRSTDYGKSWLFNSGSFAESAWDFAEPGGAFAAPAILQFGQGYQDSRDDYVYLYSEKIRNVFQPDILLARVLKTQIMDRGSYEFFAGLDPSSGSPLWSISIHQAQSVFRDTNGVGWGFEATYSSTLDRYLFTVRHDETGGWGIFDAPEPWGPWTTVAYYDGWLDSTEKFMFSFTQKWMSADGRNFDMVFSGVDAYDSWNVIRGRFILADDRPTP